MARSGKWVRVFVGGYDLTVKTTEADPGGVVYDVIDKSGYTQDKNYILGQCDSEMVIDGMFDVDTTEAALSTPGAAEHVTMVFGNNTLPVLGDPSFSLYGCQPEYKVNAAKGGLQAVTARFKPRAGTGTPVEMGVLLLDDTVTATGGASSNDYGAQTTAGAVGYCHLYGVSDSDTITIKIQDSANNSDWADLITFTLDGSAIGAERVATSATETVDRYVRAYYTISGTDPSFDVAVTFIRN